MRIAICGEQWSACGFGRVSASLNHEFQNLGVRSLLLGVGPKYFNPANDENWRKTLRSYEPDIVLFIGAASVYPSLSGEFRALAPNALQFIYFVFEYELTPFAARGAKSADKIIVPTHWAANELRRRAPLLSSRIHVVPHGIDRNIFRPDRFKPEGRQGARSKFAKLANMSTDQLSNFLILNGNTNTARKKIQFSLDAFALFCATGRDAQMVLTCPIDIEETYCSEDVKRLYASGKIITLRQTYDDPELHDDDMNIVFNACDIGLNTALAEGWGLVSWEHAATGAVQFVSASPVIKEIWDDAAEFFETIKTPIAGEKGQFGYVVDPVDVSSKIIALYDDKKRLEQMSTRCFMHVTQQKFSWTSVAKTWVEIMTQSILPTENVVS